jgi:2-oxo-4-hydroxy-4-carboxy-5-ureidoimidazoline decarboxylase
MKIAEFNDLAPRDAREVLRGCCGASRWVREMNARSPYASLDDLLRAADAAWEETGPEDWEEAFAHHPRIGEAEAATPVSETAREWSAGEQGAVAKAEAAVRTGLALGNREYEQRFGRIFIVCAGGRSPEELLENLRSRLSNSPVEELRIAAAEQGKITRQRLGKLFSDRGATTR